MSGNSEMVQNDTFSFITKIHVKKRNKNSKVQSKFKSSIDAWRNKFDCVGRLNAPFHFTHILAANCHCVCVNRGIVNKTRLTFWHLAFQSFRHYTCILICIKLIVEAVVNICCAFHFKIEYFCNKQWKLVKERQWIIKHLKRWRRSISW